MNHSFDVNVATQVGVNAAIVFQDMGFWCEHSRINKKNYHDGLYWTYNSISALSERWPYMSTKAIRTAIQKLIDAEMLTTGNYNPKGWDRTLWYALTQKGECIYRNGKMDSPKKENPQAQKGEPIPYTLSDTYTDNIKGAKAPRFTPPTVDEVREYAREKGYSPQEFDPEDFIDFYSSKGWMVGKSKMQNWHSSVSTWVRRYRKEHPAPDPEPTPGPYHDGLTDEERQRKIEEMNEAERRKEWGEDWFERYAKK